MASRTASPFAFCPVRPSHWRKTHSEKARKDIWYLVSCQIIFKRRWLVSAAAFTKKFRSFRLRNLQKQVINCDLKCTCTFLCNLFTILIEARWCDGSSYEINISHKCSKFVTIPKNIWQMVVQRKSFRGCQELKTKAYEICGARKSTNFPTKYAKSGQNLELCVIAGLIWNVYKMYKVLVIWNVYKMWQNLGRSGWSERCDKRSCQRILLKYFTVRWRWQHGGGWRGAENLRRGLAYFLCRFRWNIYSLYCAPTTPFNKLQKKHLSSRQ